MDYQTPLCSGAFLKIAYQVFTLLLPVYYVDVINLDLQNL